MFFSSAKLLVIYPLTFVLLLDSGVPWCEVIELAPRFSAVAKNTF